MGRITIRDIAKLLQVNPSTVSRALKDHPDIGTAMKAKVNEVAQSLGYMPNYQAIQFRQRKSNLIGFIIPEMGRFFAPDLVRAVEEITKRKGYNFIIFQSNELLKREKECIALCQSFGVDGLLISVSRETKSLDHFSALRSNNIPVVFVDKVIHEENIAKVIIDDYEAAFNAINHLAKKNYRNIAGVFADENLMISQHRKAGFKGALTKHNLPYRSEFCIHSSATKDTKERVERLLEGQDRPDAIFCMTDELLTSVMQVIYEKGLIIPEDVAVICISNGYLPYYMNPKITFIKHSGYKVGEAAANMLLDLIEHSSGVIQNHLEMETYLVELDSC